LDANDTLNPNDTQIVILGCFGCLGCLGQLVAIGMLAAIVTVLFMS